MPIEQGQLHEENWWLFIASQSCLSSTIVHIANLWQMADGIYADFGINYLSKMALQSARRIGDDADGLYNCNVSIWILESDSRI